MSAKCFKSDFHALVQAQRTVKSQSGYAFNISGDVWSLHGKDLKFDRLEQLAARELVSALKSTFATIIEDKKVADRTVTNYFEALRNLLSYTHKNSGNLVNEINDVVLKNWINSAPSLTYPRMVKSFIQKAKKRGNRGFESVSAEVLIKITGFQDDYVDVLTLDPDRGPWLEAEVLAQDAALERAYTTGDLPAEKYLFVQLVRRYGPRNTQLANLKVRDVRLPNLQHEVAEAAIRFPWAKANQEVSVSPWRPLRADIENAMLVYLDARLKNIPRRDWGNLPFFTPAGLPGVWDRSGTTPKASKASGFEGHILPNTVASRFVSVMKGLGLTTNRTGEIKPMSFNTHRERHTIGTRLALQGLNAGEIADMLMHVKPESCEAYVHLGVQHFQLMRKKLDVPMAPVAANFLNEPVEHDELFEGEMDVIVSRDIENFPVAGGGKCGSCPFKIDGSAPWACLTCAKFRVFADANLSLLWDELQHRKSYLYDENGEFNHRYDPNMEKTFERHEQALLNAEARRQEYCEKHSLIEG